ncbi:hypothetical protein Sfulv_04410 [Streptomyces fulvorobeus]|uniref:Uncharacterized protein n=1 Tax=Streptomyces fulvorobeus TaxID=284028 RepID=A0A7J0BZE0_9ACTN|nr:hypothetical protein Sfulv_04410 [Streptomyces fulvorobeus]
MHAPTLAGRTLRLSGGWGTTGPATPARPACDIRVNGSLVEVRLRHLSEAGASRSVTAAEDGRWTGGPGDTWRHRVPAATRPRERAGHSPCSRPHLPDFP